MGQRFYFMEIFCTFFVIILHHGVQTQTFQLAYYDAPTSTEQILYLLAVDLRNYTEAVQDCQMIPGGYLSLPKDASQNSFLFEVTRTMRARQEILGTWGGGLMFYGADDQATERSWVDRNGDNLEYTEWASTEPNGGEQENCLASGSNNYLDQFFNGDPVWFDVPCSAGLLYTCQLSTAIQGRTQCGNNIHMTWFRCASNICPIDGTVNFVQSFSQCAFDCLLRTSCWSFQYRATDGRCLQSQNGSMIDLQHETLDGTKCCHRN